MAPLRMNATVSDGRITVTFSHKRAAVSFDDYLKFLDNSFYETQQCEFIESKNQVSLNLPSGIATEPQQRPKDVTLIFDNAEDAEAWGEKMILWKQRLPEANKRRLSRDLTFEKLGIVIMDKKAERIQMQNTEPTPPSPPQIGVVFTKSVNNSKGR